MTGAFLFGDAIVARQYLDGGIAHFKADQFALAVAAFDAALEINPNDSYARWNRATALLSMGDYAVGFAEHEVAWRLFHWRGFGPVKDDIDRVNQLPHWRGDSDCRLLVYHELGFGDAIMAFRFLPELKRRAEVTLVIDDSLARLARGFDVEVVTKVPADLGDYDFRLPLFGTMSALGITAQSIPAAPYIPSQWFHDGGKLGIAWSGRTQTMFTLQRFLELLDYRGFELYALQPGPLPRLDVVELPPDCDFVDVLVRIEEMDHIVSVDTAAAHLAGAMGHPSAHLILPRLMDWRWWRTELWYPTLTTYRQTVAEDWSAPFQRLNEALHGKRSKD